MQHFSFIVYTCAALLPVFASSCSVAEQSPVSSAGPYSSVISANIQRAGGVSFDTEDAIVLVYGSSGKLESYQKESITSGKMSLWSTGGEKTAVVIANYSDSLLDFRQIASLELLDKLKADYTQENPSKPVASGIISYNTADKTEKSLVLRPLLAKVEIRFFSVDFKGKPYEGQGLDDARAYLLNLNGFCPVLGKPESVNAVINYGRYDYDTESAISHKEMAYSRKVAGATLFCYPVPPKRNWESGQLGGCVTKLVIEGRIDGNVYYYPIEVGTGGLIESGRNYVYDIIIRSKGTTDPDMTASAEMMDVKIYTKQWTDNESSVEYF